MVWLDLPCAAGVVQPQQPGRPCGTASGRDRRQQRTPRLAELTPSAAGIDSSQQQQPEPPLQPLQRRPEVFLGLADDSEAAAPTHAASLLSPLLAMRPPAAAATAALLALLAAAPAPAAAFSLQDAVGGLEQLVQQAGILGPLVFVGAYILATVVLVPASLLTLAAGFLFGPVLGTAVVSVASTGGAAAAFLVGRYLARPAVEKRIEGNARFAAVDAAIGREGAKIVLLLRLSPLFPFTLLNYALSLTKIEFAPYVLSSWLGMLPGTVAYVAIGGAGKAAAETAAGGGAGPLQLVLYAVGAGATLWATALISKAASKALDEAAAAGGADGQPLKQDE